MNQKKDMRQIKAIEKANRERLLKVNRDLGLKVKNEGRKNDRE